MRISSGLNPMFGRPTVNHRSSPKLDLSFIEGSQNSTSNETVRGSSSVDKVQDTSFDDVFERKALTQEQKDYLKEKYNIKGMEYNSDEHISFMNELHDMGAISKDELAQCFMYDAVCCGIYDENGEQIVYKEGSSMHTFRYSLKMFDTYSTGFEGYMTIYQQMLRNSKTPQSAAAAEEIRSWAQGAKQMTEVINSIFE